jgi:hypothetical protein
MTDRYLDFKKNLLLGHKPKKTTILNLKINQHICFTQQESGRQQPEAAEELGVF